jgi:YegS/Rv2252/BmrU family lipid kinase
MPILVVINPASSRGDTAREAARIATVFTRRGLLHHIVRTERRGHAAELVREQGADFDAVVAVGGDGTLHEVIQGLDLAHHRLGVVPRGSGNDFAWMNAWPADLAACADRIAAGHEHRIDLGTWNGGRFHTSIGVGFEAQVNHESRRIKRLRGTAIYLAALLRTLQDLRSYDTRITWHEGEWSGHMLLASIGNGRRVGGAFLLTPAARNDDGMLDICFAPRMSLARLLGILPRTFSGTHVHMPPVQVQRSAWIRLEAPAGFPVHVDGEMIGLEITHLDLGVAPGVLRTF